MPRTHVLDQIPAQLWRLVKLARHRLLMFDYDGTLAPFRVTRDEAAPVAGSLERLHRIAASGHTTLAIVTGRPLREVERFLDGLPALFVGEHGWERRTPDGGLFLRPVPPAAALALEQAVTAAEVVGCGEWLERKRTSVVLHTRAMSEMVAAEMQRRCEEAWAQIAAGGRVTLDRIQGGIEIRAWGCNKGTAALSLLSHTPPGSIGVFVGDDVTDEDAFDAVREWGFGIRVGPKDGPTLAMGHLRECEAVPEFLDEWLDVTRREGEPHTAAT